METIQPEILRKARKQHICSECEEPILKGEKYYHSVFKCDDIYSWKSHLACREMSMSRPKAYEDNWTDEGIPALHSIWEHHWDEIVMTQHTDEWSLWMVKKFSKEQA